MVHLNNDWDDILADEFKKPYYLKLREFLKEEYGTKTIYPNMNNIFSALKASSYKDTKVVILGQDPYHEPNQAHGLCFSVLKGVTEMMNNPRKTRRYVEEVSKTNAYSCAEYAAQFVNLVNSFPRRELPYLIIGVKCAIKAILKADAEPELKHKVAELDELCGKVLKAYAFSNDRGSGNAE